jgi:hypothetical protein
VNLKFGTHEISGGVKIIFDQYFVKNLSLFRLSRQERLFPIAEKVFKKATADMKIAKI